MIHLMFYDIGIIGINVEVGFGNFTFYRTFFLSQHFELLKYHVYTYIKTVFATMLNLIAIIYHYALIITHYLRSIKLK